MSSKHLSNFLVASLFAGSSFSTFASDQNIPQPSQAQKSRVFHSGATSANSDSHRFNRPLTKEEVMAGNVPHMMPPTHQKPNKPIPDAPIGHNKPNHPASSSHSKKNCPAGSEKGWIIEEGDQRYMLLEDGTKIDLQHPGHSAHAHSAPSHDVVEEETEEARNLKRNPLLTPEEEKLREEVESKGIGSFYDRPNHGSHEFGKELNGKVYFKATSGVKGYKPGLWVEDPNVKPKGLKERPKTGKIPKFTGPESLSVEPAKPHEHIKPGAVGLTARTNTAQTNPKTGKVEMEQGRANVAQTGLTGAKEAPHVDTSEKGIPVPPPLPSKKPSTTNETKQALPDQGVDKPAETAAAAA